MLDPQGKVVQQTLQDMGMKALKDLRQGKYFEININEKDEKRAKEIIEDMCKKLLVNLIPSLSKIKLQCKYIKVITWEMPIA